jgi:hypothetical protein
MTGIGSSNSIYAHLALAQCGDWPDKLQRAFDETRPLKRPKNDGGDVGDVGGDEGGDEGGGGWSASCDAGCRSGLVELGNAMQVQSEKDRERERGRRRQRKRE